MNALKNGWKIVTVTSAQFVGVKQFNAHFLFKHFTVYCCTFLSYNMTHIMTHNMTHIPVINKCSVTLKMAFIFVSNEVALNADK